MKRLTAFLIPLLTATAFFSSLSGHCLRLTELGFHTGYGYGELRRPHKDLHVTHFICHLGFELNEVFHMHGHKGKLSLVVEPFFDPVVCPGGFETGAVVMFEYAYPVCQKFSLYLEGGAGPGYFSKRTREQGGGGFNFFDQGQVGGKVCIAENKSFIFGYRFRHISHAGLRPGSNGGINSHHLILGYTIHL